MNNRINWKKQAELLKAKQSQTIQLPGITTVRKVAELQGVKLDPRHSRQQKTGTQVLGETIQYRTEVRVIDGKEILVRVPIEKNQQKLPTPPTTRKAIDPLDVPQAQSSETAIRLKPTPPPIATPTNLGKLRNTTLTVDASIASTVSNSSSVSSLDSPEGSPKSEATIQNVLKYSLVNLSAKIKKIIPDDYNFGNVKTNPARGRQQIIIEDIEGEEQRQDLIRELSLQPGSYSINSVEDEYKEDAADLVLNKNFEIIYEALNQPGKVDEVKARLQLRWNLRELMETANLDDENRAVFMKRLGEAEGIDQIEALERDIQRKIEEKKLITALQILIPVDLVLEKDFSINIHMPSTDDPVIRLTNLKDRSAAEAIRSQLRIRESIGGIILEKDQVYELSLGDDLETANIDLNDLMIEGSERIKKEISKVYQLKGFQSKLRDFINQHQYLDDQDKENYILKVDQTKEPGELKPIQEEIEKLGELKKLEAKIHKLIPLDLLLNGTKSALSTEDSILSLGQFKDKAAFQAISKALHFKAEDPDEGKVYKINLGKDLIELNKHFDRLLTNNPKLKDEISDLYELIGHQNDLLTWLEKQVSLSEIARKEFTTQIQAISEVSQVESIKKEILTAIKVEKLEEQIQALIPSQYIADPISKIELDADEEAVIIKIRGKDQAKAVGNIFGCIAEKMTEDDIYGINLGKSLEKINQDLLKILENETHPGEVKERIILLSQLLPHRDEVLEYLNKQKIIPQEAVVSLRSELNLASSISELDKIKEKISSVAENLSAKLENQKKLTELRANLEKQLDKISSAEDREKFKKEIGLAEGEPQIMLIDKSINESLRKQKEEEDLQLRQLQIEKQRALEQELELTRQEKLTQLRTSLENQLGSISSGEAQEVFKEKIKLAIDEPKLKAIEKDIHKFLLNQQKEEARQQKELELQQKQEREKAQAELLNNIENEKQKQQQQAELMATKKELLSLIAGSIEDLELKPKLIQRVHQLEEKNHFELLTHEINDLIKKQEQEKERQRELALSIEKLESLKRDELERARLKEKPKLIPRPPQLPKETPKILTKEEVRKLILAKNMEAFRNYANQTREVIRDKPRAIQNIIANKLGDLDVSRRMAGKISGEELSRIQLDLQRSIDYEKRYLDSVVKLKDGQLPNRTIYFQLLDKMLSEKLSKLEKDFKENRLELPELLAAYDQFTLLYTTSNDMTNLEKLEGQLRAGTKTSDVYKSIDSLYETMTHNLKASGKFSESPLTEIIKSRVRRMIGTLQTLGGLIDERRYQDSLTLYNNILNQFGGEFSGLDASKLFEKIDNNVYKLKPLEDVRAFLTVSSLYRLEGVGFFDKKNHKEIALSQELSIPGKHAIDGAAKSIGMKLFLLPNEPLDFSYVQNMGNNQVTPLTIYMRDKFISGDKEFQKVLSLLDTKHQREVIFNIGTYLTPDNLLRFTEKLARELAQFIKQSQADPGISEHTVKLVNSLLDFYGKDDSFYYNSVADNPYASSYLITSILRRLENSGYMSKDYEVLKLKSGQELHYMPTGSLSLSYIRDTADDTPLPLTIVLSNFNELNKFIQKELPTESVPYFLEKNFANLPINNLSELCKIFRDHLSGNQTAIDNILDKLAQAPRFQNQNLRAEDLTAILSWASENKRSDFLNGLGKGWIIDGFQNPSKMAELFVQLPTLKGKSQSALARQYITDLDKLEAVAAKLTPEKQRDLLHSLELEKFPPAYTGHWTKVLAILQPQERQVFFDKMQGLKGLNRIIDINKNNYREILMKWVQPYLGQQKTSNTTAPSKPQLRVNVDAEALTEYGNVWRPAAPVGINSTLEYYIDNDAADSIVPSITEKGDIFNSRNQLMMNVNEIEGYGTLLLLALTDREKNGVTAPINLILKLLDPGVPVKINARNISGHNAITLALSPNSCLAGNQVNVFLEKILKNKELKLDPNDQKEILIAALRLGRPDIINVLTKNHNNKPVIFIDPDTIERARKRTPKLVDLLVKNYNLQQAYLGVLQQQRFPTPPQERSQNLPQRPPLPAQQGMPSHKNLPTTSGLGGSFAHIHSALSKSLPPLTASQKTLMPLDSNQELVSLERNLRSSRFVKNEKAIFLNGFPAHLDNDSIYIVRRHKNSGGYSLKFSDPLKTDDLMTRMNANGISCSKVNDFIILMPESVTKLAELASRLSQPQAPAKPLQVERFAHKERGLVPHVNEPANDLSEDVSMRKPPGKKS